MLSVCQVLAPNSATCPQGIRASAHALVPLHRNQHEFATAFVLGQLGDVTRHARGFQHKLRFRLCAAEKNVQSFQG